MTATRRNHLLASLLGVAWLIGALAVGDPGYPQAASARPDVAHPTTFLPTASAAPSVATARASGRTTPAPTLAVSSHRCPQYEALLAELSPGWDVATMSRLMWRESRCTPTAYNRRTHDWGALQIHWSNRYYTVPMRMGYGPLARECGISSPAELLDVRTNVRCAAVLWRAFQYRPWGLR